MRRQLVNEAERLKDIKDIIKRLPPPEVGKSKEKRNEYNRRFYNKHYKALYPYQHVVRRKKSERNRRSNS